MSALLRSAPPALVTALASGQKLWEADLVDVLLSDGVTAYHWTTWDSDLTLSGVHYASKAPWISKPTWNVTNTMEVPTAKLNLLSLDSGFAGGASLKAQVHDGLFDGAALTLSEAYMPAPGDVTTLGAVTVFGGKIAGIDLDGITAAIAAKGKTNDLDQYAPRNIYQVGCNHAFCDAGCALSRASFTTPFTVGLSPTTTFIPWNGTPPTNPQGWQNGTIVFTSGAAAGARRTIAKADSSGATLVYPLYVTPAHADTFTGLQGCDKSFDSGSGQSCTDYSNTQHYRGFPYVPPPNSAY